MGLFRILIACCLTFCTIYNSGTAAPDPKQTQSESCVMLSIPKCGTHLLKKLIMMLTDLKPNRLVHLHSRVHDLTPQEFEAAILDCFRKRQMIVSHTNPILFNDLFLRFSDRHPKFPTFIQIRNLGDTIVSLVKFRLGPIKAEIGGQPTFDQVLTHFLQRDNCIIARSFTEMIDGALLWLDRPDAIILRFEDLVGVSGGGTLESQKKAIKTVAKALKVSLTKERLDEIANSLFGNDVGPYSPTFRQGQVGGWRQHFKPVHIKLFNEHWGHYQALLGYPVLEE